MQSALELSPAMSNVHGARAVAQQRPQVGDTSGADWCLGSEHAR
jgi:hypothetical protein